MSPLAIFTLVAVTAADGVRDRGGGTELEAATGRSSKLSVFLAKDAADVPEDLGGVKSVLRKQKAAGEQPSEDAAKVDEERGGPRRMQARGGRDGDERDGGERDIGGRDRGRRDSGGRNLSSRSSADAAAAALNASALNAPTANATAANATALVKDANPRCGGDGQIECSFFNKWVTQSYKVPTHSGPTSPSRSPNSSSAGNVSAADQQLEAEAAQRCGGVDQLECTVFNKWMTLTYTVSLLRGIVQWAILGYLVVTFLLCAFLCVRQLRSPSHYRRPPPVASQRRRPSSPSSTEPPG